MKVQTKARLSVALLIAATDVYSAECGPDGFSGQLQSILGHPGEQIKRDRHQIIKSLASREKSANLSDAIRNVFDLKNDDPLFMSPNDIGRWDGTRKPSPHLPTKGPHITPDVFVDNLAGVLRQFPGLLNSNQSVLFHGSKSDVLVSLARNESHGLLPLGSLIEKGIAPFSGTLDNGALGIGQVALSTVDVTRVRFAFPYAGVYLGPSGLEFSELGSGWCPEKAGQMSEANRRVLEARYGSFGKKIAEMSDKVENLRQTQWKELRARNKMTHRCRWQMRQAASLSRAS